MTLVIGIDPGGATTGIALRDGSTYVAHDLVHRSDFDGWGEYLYAVVDTVSRRMIRYEHPDPVIGMEDLKVPNPHMGTISVQGLLDVARVDGALRLSFDLVIVPPGGNGSRPLDTYPTELVGPREPKGTGILRHARSAWDVAGRVLDVRRLSLNPTLFTPTKDPDA